MTAWETLSAAMDARVENDLGDSISITFDDGSTATVLGFLSNNADAPSVEGIDPVRIAWHAQIAKARLPNGPKSIKRMTHRFLDGPYKAAADTISESGDDFLFDLQRTR